ncbi:transmembrane 9 superfamily member 1 [Podarcis raffonei]|uniref:transmembrane 9 superfamily member 1 n=1 Tax=Podarcis raffonei TaxID=65483 RepID=UPI0023297628|nr:transmembrane 9 superfamily member 1 [Podarcis raffonei]
MSGLGKLFGKGKKAKAPTPQEAIQKLRETEEVLVKKQEFLEQKIQQELQSAKKHGTKNKRAALQALKRKKRYEQQLGQIDGTLSTIEFQREALENATTNTEVLKTMSDAARAMKEAHQHMDIDKVDDLMAEITEQQDIAQQISDAISKPVGFGDDVDEDELLAELEEMEQEDLDKELLNVGEPTPELPSVPASRLPSVPENIARSLQVRDSSLRSPPIPRSKMSPLLQMGFSWVLVPLICPVLRVRLAAFFLSGVKVRERDLVVLGVVAFLLVSAARGPQIASRALISVVGFSARNLRTQGTLSTSRMFSRLEAGRRMRWTSSCRGERDRRFNHRKRGGCRIKPGGIVYKEAFVRSEQLLEVGVVEGQVGHHQGVEDNPHAPDVGKERVVGQAQQDLGASVGEAAAVGLAQVREAAHHAVRRRRGRLRLGGHHLGEAKVRDLDVFTLVEEKVLEFQVPAVRKSSGEKKETGDLRGRRKQPTDVAGPALGDRLKDPEASRASGPSNDPPQPLAAAPPRWQRAGEERRWEESGLGAGLKGATSLLRISGPAGFEFFLLVCLILHSPSISSSNLLSSPRPSSHSPFSCYHPMMARPPFLVLLLLFFLLSLLSTASSETHYQRGDPVMLYVNKVGPYHNPQETYHYYQLPVCSPENIRHKSLTLGEVLDGDRMAESMYEIRFRENVDKKVLCEMKLTPEQVERLRQAIEELYYFEFVVDDLPLRGFVGYMEESGFLPHTHKIGLWTHLDFHLEWNGDRIIYANVSVRNVKPTSLDDVRSVLPVAHTYSVRWSETALERRGDRRGSRDDGFFPRTLEIHWLSIINSMVLVFLLVGFVVVILMRVLKNDLARYNLDEEASTSSSGDDFDQGDNGWKIIHTDVFRFPPCRSLLCAVLGVGSQFLALGTGIIVMALLGMFNVHRHGAINSAAILLYALTCCISGYVSSNFYRQIGGERWVWNILLTTSLFSAPFFLTWSVVNSVHWANGSTQALPATTILLLLTVWLLVGFPLTVIGGIFGKNRAGPFDAPCRTKNIAREIPPQPWYKSTLVHMTIGGFLPFSAISVELYYIFATVWGREQYTLYGILFFVFAILLSVGACISIALTYFQLSGEDYRWWWRSVLSAGSTGLFIFLYSVFYYSRRSNMSGAVQTVEFFGYSLLTGYVFFLMLGTISFFASLKFIRYIYVNLKMD